jgi:pimeloyl-ACP methyl ester carboxylesterase
MTRRLRPYHVAVHVPRSPVRLVAAVVAMATLAVAACGTVGDVSVDRADRRDGATDTSDGDGRIRWEICGDELDCGTLTVPRDHDDPSSDTFELALVRHLAREPDRRIGSLLVNPGGPGYGGTFLAEQAPFIYSSEILDRFDIIGFDPRGTGDSRPAIDCVDDYDPWLGLDASPDDSAERAALIAAEQNFVDGCIARSGEILPFVSTDAAARDMDLIRRALGEKQISYFGFSYGSELGAVWATLFPRTVRAAVLDGAVDPTADAVESGLQQATGFEEQLAVFLADCSANDDCAFHNGGDAEGAFDELMRNIDDAPLVVSDDRTPVTEGVAFIAIANALYRDTLWLELQTALDDAQQGDGSGLLALFDDYLDRSPDGTYDDTFEAFTAISCLDDPGPSTIEDVDALSERFTEAAPRLGAYFSSGYVCTLWPVDPVERVAISGAGVGPILVIGTTGDAATPLAGTRTMADTLEDGRLVVVDARQHTGYGANECVMDAVDAYLVELRPPDTELLCR